MVDHLLSAYVALCLPLGVLQLTPRQARSTLTPHTLHRCCWIDASSRPHSSADACLGWLSLPCRYHLAPSDCIAGLSTAAISALALSPIPAAVTGLAGLLSFRLGYSLRLVGLTGGIGTGKSTVARQMHTKHGLPIIDADKLGHLVQEPGRRAHRKLVDAFGMAILQDEKNRSSPIDRNKLSSHVFGAQNKKQRAVLNSITHPMIFLELLKQLLSARFMGGQKHVLFDAPLLFESGPLALLCRPIVVVACSSEVQLQRVTSRDKSASEDAVKRIQSQMPIEAKVRRADAVVDNNGTLEQLKAHVDELIQLWQLYSAL